MEAAGTSTPLENWWQTDDDGVLDAGSAAHRYELDERVQGQVFTDAPVQHELMEVALVRSVRHGDGDGARVVCVSLDRWRLNWFVFSYTVTYTHFTTARIATRYSLAFIGGYQYLPSVRRRASVVLGWANVRYLVLVRYCSKSNKLPPRKC